MVPFYVCLQGQKESKTVTFLFPLEKHYLGLTQKAGELTCEAVFLRGVLIN